MATVDLLVQDDVDVSLIICVFCLNVPLLLVIIGGNAVVMVSVYQKRELAKTPNNIFMSSLALVDFLNGLIGVPLSIVGYLLRRNFLYSVNCAIWYFAPCIILVHVSVFHLIMITFDRFFAIKYPLRYHIWMSTERAVRCCLYVDLISVILGSISFVIPAFAGLVVTPNITFEYDCGASALYNIYGAPVFYYFVNPFVALTIPCLFIMYGYVFSVASKAAMQAATLHGKTISKREMKATKTAAIVLLAYTMCMAPTALKGVIQGYLDNGSTWLVWYPWFADYIGIANSMINPFIYAGRSVALRKEFMSSINFIVNRKLCPCLNNKIGTDTERWASSEIDITRNTVTERESVEL